MSMTVGAIVLMALDKESISAGPFSLASYTNLDPVEEAARRVSTLNIHEWEKIEVSYSKTESGNIASLAGAEELATTEDVNFHFVICNGEGGMDGLIETAKRWQMQRPCLPGKDWYGNGETIRICLIADGIGQMPTDCQIQRTTALIDALSRDFNLSAERIAYPNDWKL